MEYQSVWRLWLSACAFATWLDNILLISKNEPKNTKMDETSGNDKKKGTTGFEIEKVNNLIGCLIRVQSNRSPVEWKGISNFQDHNEFGSFVASRDALYASAKPWSTRWKR